MNYQELEELHSELKELKSSFERQVNVLNSDTSSFHKQLLDISSRYPDHKEILEFIVFINDRAQLSTAQFSDIVVDTLDEFLNHKIELIKMLKRSETSKTKQVHKKILNPFNLTKTDLKFFISAGVVFLALASFLVYPKETAKIVESLNPITKSAK